MSEYKYTITCKGVILRIVVPSETSSTSYRNLYQQYATSRGLFNTATEAKEHIKKLKISNIKMGLGVA